MDMSQEYFSTKEEERMVLEIFLTLYPIFLCIWAETMKKQVYPSCRQQTIKHEAILKYDSSKWHEEKSKPLNTLQVFITNRCNLKCKGCFYSHKLSQEEMNMKTYKSHVLDFLKEIKKVIILGGEPTLYKHLDKVIRFNNEHNLKTTIYTNGTNLKILEKMDKKDLKNTSIRVGVHGAKSGDKPLTKVPKTSLPVTIVYMLRKDNVCELTLAANMAEKEFNCKKFYISSIRDITKTQDYWKDTKETLNMQKYFKEVQNFIKIYEGNLDIHIATRGIMKTKYDARVGKCRFGNIFPDNKKIICPLDISKKTYTDKLIFNKRRCNKNKNCILTKIILKNKRN